jgi:hypothetical protein
VHLFFLLTLLGDSNKHFVKGVSEDGGIRFSNTSQQHKSPIRIVVSDQCLRLFVERVCAFTGSITVNHVAIASFFIVCSGNQGHVQDLLANSQWNETPRLLRNQKGSQQQEGGVLSAACAPTDCPILYGLGRSEPNSKTASPLSYLFQAAMGQCSTLPMEGRQQEPARGYNMPDYGMEESPQQQSPSRYGSRHGTPNNNNILQVTVPRTDEKPRPPPPSQPFQQQQQHQSRETFQTTMEMQPEMREAPPPLDIAKRTRCYQLNLDSDFVGVIGDVRVEGNLLGPYEQPPPPLTYSASDDSSSQTDPITVAIRTAQIFRGITVSEDGIILTQNARASRSNRGNKTKRGEKSRQAAKIEKAKDLVEESMLTGKVS